MVVGVLAKPKMYLKVLDAAYSFEAASVKMLHDMQCLCGCEKLVCLLVRPQIVDRNRIARPTLIGDEIVGIVVEPGFSFGKFNERTSIVGVFKQCLAMCAGILASTFTQRDR